MSNSNRLFYIEILRNSFDKINVKRANKLVDKVVNKTINTLIVLEIYQLAFDNIKLEIINFNCNIVSVYEDFRVQNSYIREIRLAIINFLVKCYFKKEEK